MKIRLFKPYLRYSNRERKSFFNLVVLLLILATIYCIIHFRTGTVAYILQPLPGLKENHTAIKDSLYAPYKPVHRALQRFNPNKVDLNNLIEMGIPSKAAHNWVKYIQKGGLIKTANGLSKIYGLDSTWCFLLGPYLDFESKPNPEPSILNSNSSNIDFKKQRFDPNTAAKEQFIVVGLTPPLARVIMNYRTKGGSFKQASDLLKIFGMNDSLLSLISPYLVFDSENYAGHDQVRNFDSRSFKR